MGQHQNVGMVPSATRDLEQGSRDLAEHGVCVIAGVLEGDALTEARDALYRAAAQDRRFGQRLAYQYGKDDSTNQRIWNLPSHDTLFCELLEHPVAMHFVRSVLGWPALISSMSANILGPGGASMILHADQGYTPAPWNKAHGINVAWALDDFTRENGATSFVPGSHRLGRNRMPDEPMPELVPLEAPAGSVIVMDGRLWHTNGANTTQRTRAGIFSWYTLPIYLPQENWFLSLNPSIRQFGSETLLTLLGFKPTFLGRINGADRL